MRIERIQNATITAVICSDEPEIGTAGFINYVNNDTDCKHVRFADFDKKDIALREYLKSALVDEAVVKLVIERDAITERDTIVRVTRR